MKTDILEKNANLSSNGKEVVITKQMQESYTKEDLRQMLNQIEMNQARLVQQVDQIREQNNKLETQKVEIVELLSMLPDNKDDFKL